MTPKELMVEAWKLRYPGMDADSEVDLLLGIIDIAGLAIVSRSALEGVRGALERMLAHSCVADTAGDDKDAEDHAAESAARSALSRLKVAGP